MSKYLVLNPDESWVSGEVKPTLSVLQAAVEGYVEVVSIRGYGNPDMWLNEEGKLTGHRTNIVATRIAHETESIFPSDYIAGPVVFTGGVDRYGNTKPLTKTQERLLRGV